MANASDILNPKVTSGHDALVWLSTTDDPEYKDLSLYQMREVLRANQFDTSDPAVQNFVISRPVTPGLSESQTQSSLQKKKGAAYERLIEQGYTEDQATGIVSSTSHAIRTPDGEQHFLPTKWNVGDNIQSLLDEGASGREIYAKSLLPLTVQEGSDAISERESLAQKQAELESEYESAIEDEDYERYIKDYLDKAQRIPISDPTEFIPPLSRARWEKGILKQARFDDIRRYRELAQMDLTPDMVVKDGIAWTTLRDLSAVSSSIMGGLEASLRQAKHGADNLAQAAGWYNFQDYLTDKDSLISPGLSQAVSTEILPKRITSKGKTADAGQETGAAVARHTARGFGLIGSYDAGHKLDVLFGIKEPGEGASFGFNIGTLFGGTGFLVESFNPLSLGLIGSMQKGTAALKHIKELENIGLLTPAIKASIKADFKAERLNALRKGLTRPVDKVLGNIIAKPVDYTAAKLLGKDLELASALSKWSGGKYSPEDIRALAVTAWANDTYNISNAEFVLNTMQRAVLTPGARSLTGSMDGISDVASLKRWFDAQPDWLVGEFNHFKASLDSLGIKLDDSFVQGFRKSLVEAEQVAAVRARAMSTSLPQSVRGALLGKESPLDQALKAVTRGSANTPKDTAMLGQALQIRAESWLMMRANDKIAEAMKQGSWDNSYMERLSSVAFSSPQVKAEAIKQVQNTIGKTLKEIVGKAGGRGDDIVLTPEQKKRLLSYFISDFRGGRPSNKTWIEDIAASPYSESTKQVLLSAAEGGNKEFRFTQRHFDALTNDALTLEAVGKSTPVTKVDEAIRALESDVPDTFMGRLGKAATELGRVGTATQRGRHLAEVYKQSFKPSELRSGFIRNTFNAVKGNIKGSQNYTDSTVQEISSFIKNRLAAGEEEFKSAMRVIRRQENPATGKKYTEEEAWVKIILDEYDIAANASRVDINLARKGRSGQVVTSDFQSNYDNLFDDYLTLIFGGQENISETVLTMGGGATKDKRALTPNRTAAVITALGELSPTLKGLKKDFSSFIQAGKLEEAMGVLTLLHHRLEGQPLSALFDNGKEGFVGIVENTMHLPEILKKANVSKRNLINDFGELAHVTPYYEAKNLSHLMGIIYGTKRVANIIDDGVARLADKAGGAIFPSTRSVVLATQADQPYRVWLINDLAQKTGLNLPPIRIGDHHRELTDLSVRRSIANRYLPHSNEAVKTNTNWEDAKTRAAKSIIGRPRPVQSQRYGTVFISDVKQYEDEIDLIKEIIEDTYVRDPRSPYKVYIEKMGDKFQSQKGAAPEGYYKNLLYSLSKTYSRVRTADAGVIPRSRLGAEIALDLPLIQPYTRSIHQDLSNAINLERRGQGNLGLDTWFQNITRPESTLERIELSEDQRNALVLKQRELSQKKEALRKATDPDVESGLMDEVAELEKQIPRLPSEGAALRAQSLRDAGNVDAFISFFVNHALNEARRTGQYESADVAKYFADLFTEGSGYAFRTASQANRFSKGGVLGGFLFMNPKYIALNELSAPFIIGQTLGADYAGFVNLEANTVVAYAHGRFPGTAANVVVESPVTGKVYRVADLARLMTSNSISRGQASAELASSFADAFVKYAGTIRNAKVLKNFRKTVKDGDNSIEAINNMMKSKSWEAQRGWNWVNRNLLTTGMNAFNQVASAADMRHRTNVFIKAIKNGKSEAEALKLAQVALHDYNALSKSEKLFWNKIIWFYTFARSQAATTLRNFIENPTRIAVGAKLARGFPQDPTAPAIQESYLLDRPYLGTLYDEYGGINVTGFKLPMAGAIYEMGTYLSPLAHFFDEKQSIPNAAKNALRDAGVVIAGKSNPLGKFAAGVLTKKELKFGDVRDLSNYADPSLIYMINKSPVHKKIFDEFVRVKAKSATKVTQKHSSFEGITYELDGAESKLNYYIFVQMMLLTGHERTMRDWAPMVMSAEKMIRPGSRKGELTSVKLDARSTPLQWLRNAGFIHLTEVSTKGTQSQAKDQTGYDLDELGAQK